VLWESNAINWYVAEKHPRSRLLPQSIEDRAKVQRWLFFQSAHVTPACIPIFRATNARVQEFWKTKGDPQPAEGARKELARYLPVLEAALEGSDWLERDFSLADIAYAPHFRLIAEGGFDFAPYPRVRAWLDRLLARPAWHRAEQLVLA
jgi:glutathione S-transferase